ncbi:MAG: hypothetical protein HQM08_28790 [Candidatus Riflebacteria bacterium]|nr:hypothetical protein [Candidatus Riflebacteria bacterium]
MKKRGFSVDEEVFRKISQELSSTADKISLKVNILFSRTSDYDSIVLFGLVQS